MCGCVAAIKALDGWVGPSASLLLAASPACIVVTAVFWRKGGTLTVLANQADAAQVTFFAANRGQKLAENLLG